MNLLKPRLGRRCHVHPTALIGEIPSRKGLKLQALRVGDGALIRSGSVLYSGTTIGSDFETGHHIVVREQNRIGHDVSIWNHTTIDYGCTIGNRVKIHCNVYIAQYSILEDDVFIAPGVVFANDLYPKGKHAAKVLQGPRVQRGAAIGVNCTVLPGVVIGPGALIGSGSVVTHDMPAGAVAWGNPARIYKYRRDLRWPAMFRLSRADAQLFYRRQLAGRPVDR